MNKQEPFVSVPCEQCSGTGRLTVSKLSVLRKNSGMSQEDVGQILGLTRTSIANIEAGNQAIAVTNIKAFADVYGLDEYEMYDLAKRIYKPKAVSENDL